MCLKTNKKVKKLKKPKVVYKHALAFERHKDDINDSTVFTTAYRDFKLRVGETYKAVLRYKERSFSKPGIYEGLHAFKNPNVVMLDILDIWPYHVNYRYGNPRNNSFVILKCIIPAGADYVSGTTSGIPACAASELKVVSVVGIVVKEKNDNVPTLYELEENVFGGVMGGIYSLCSK
jgi:hypothetical protein